MDLVNSDQGHTVISMLLDVTGFWQYDNRSGQILVKQILYNYSYQFLSLSLIIC